MARDAVYVGGGRVLTRTKAGLKMFVDASDVSIAPHIILEGVWEEHVEAALAKIVKRGMTVFEIGANVGFFTLLMAKAVGHGGALRAFEPDPTLARFVRDNIELNGMHHQASVAEIALSDRVGTATFYARDRHRGGGSLVASIEQIPWNPTDTLRELIVPTTTIDETVAAGGLIPDLIKIDVEGAETLVLRGAQKLLAGGRPLQLVLEFIPGFFRDAGDDPAAFLAMLAGYGFRFQLIDERKRKIVPVSEDALLGRYYSELLAVR